jgi:hypothetical protein
LWNAQYEVDQLRYEEEEHRLAKVAKNAHNSKCHPREVAKGVADEYF